MKRVEFKDDRNRKYLVEIPDTLPDSDAYLGIVIGPPMDLVDQLNIPEPYATILHNQLYERRLFTSGDLNRRSIELEGAVHLAFGQVVSAIYEGYIRIEKDETFSDNQSDE